METTARLGLPLLSVAQAAKEMTVNEALTMLDAAIQPIVEGESNAPPGSPTPGQGWLVGSGATGAFAGHAGAIAVWTAGGWRFLMLSEGAMVWRRDISLIARRTASVWQSGVAVSLPSGGSTVDTQARAAIESVLARMRDFGIIAPS